MTRPKQNPARAKASTQPARDEKSPWDKVPDAAKAADAPRADVLPPLTAPLSARPAGTSVPEKAARWALLLLAVLGGAAVGLFGSLGHRASATWLGVSWPTGLLLGFAGLVGLLLGIGELLAAGAPDSWRPTRLSALGWASAGWLLALLWLTYVGPPPSFARKGDVVLANDWKSMAFLLGGMALVTAAVYRAWVSSLSARLAVRPGAPGGAHPKG